MNNFQDISREITAEQDNALAEEAKELARMELLEELNQNEEDSAYGGDGLSTVISGCDRCAEFIDL